MRSVVCGLVAAGFSVNVARAGSGIIIGGESEAAASPHQFVALPEGEVHEAVVALRLTQAALRDADETAEASGLGRQIDGLEAEEASELKGVAGAHTAPEDCDEIEARLHALEQRYYEKLAQQQAIEGAARKQQLQDLRWRIDKAQRHLERLKTFGHGGGSGATFDIDTKIVPYPGAVEPFGSMDPAQEMTKTSVQESNKMVDSIERAQAMEGKRSVYRALTHLRGATITAYDGIAASHMKNVDTYSKSHKWRDTHQVHHLAEEEADVARWAFPVDHLQGAPCSGNCTAAPEVATAAAPAAVAAASPAPAAAAPTANQTAAPAGNQTAAPAAPAPAAPAGNQTAAANQTA